jgi:hypothetical protein
VNSLAAFAMYWRASGYRQVARGKSVSNMTFRKSWSHPPYSILRAVVCSVAHISCFS